jgi:hypothetical protein
MDFGPNHHQVEDFLSSLRGIEWLSRAGQPTDDDANLRRIDLDFVLNSSDNPIEFWGDLLIKAEIPFERIILDNARLSEQAALMKAAVDSYSHELFVRLAEKFPDYDADLEMHTYQLIDTGPINRITRGAASEIMVADINPSLNFFQSLMPWFRKGHWPYGWEGQWPEGKLILW